MNVCISVNSGLWKNEVNEIRVFTPIGSMLPLLWGDSLFPPVLRARKMMKHPLTTERNLTESKLGQDVFGRIFKPRYFVRSFWGKCSVVHMSLVVNYIQPCRDASSFYPKVTWLLVGCSPVSGWPGFCESGIFQNSKPPSAHGTHAISLLVSLFFGSNHGRYAAHVGKNPYWQPGRKNAPWYNSTTPGFSASLWAQVGVKSLQQLLLSDATCISDGISDDDEMEKGWGFCWNSGDRGPKTCKLRLHRFFGINGSWNIMKYLCFLNCRWWNHSWLLRILWLSLNVLYLYWSPLTTVENNELRALKI